MKQVFDEVEYIFKFKRRISFKLTILYELEPSAADHEHAWRGGHTTMRDIHPSNRVFKSSKMGFEQASIISAP